MNKTGTSLSQMIGAASINVGWAILGGRTVRPTSGSDHGGTSQSGGRSSQSPGEHAKRGG